MKTNKLFFLIIAILTLSIASVGFAYVSEDTNTSVSEDKSALPEAQTTTETQAKADDTAVNETNPFISARLAMIEEVLAQLVEAGDITQDEADRVLAGLKNHSAAADDPIAELVFGGGKGQDFHGNMRDPFNYGDPGMPNQGMGRGKGFGMQGNGWGPKNNNGVQNQDGSGENGSMDCPCEQANPD